MWQWIVSRLGLPALHLLVASGAVLAVLAGVRRAGRNAERVEQMRNRIKEAEKTHEIRKKQLEAAADRPRGRDGVRKRMQDGNF